MGSLAVYLAAEGKIGAGRPAAHERMMATFWRACASKKNKICHMGLHLLPRGTAALAAAAAGRAMERGETSRRADAQRLLK